MSGRKNRCYRTDFQWFTRKMKFFFGYVPIIHATVVTLQRFSEESDAVKIKIFNLKTDKRWPQPQQSQGL